MALAQRPAYLQPTNDAVRSALAGGLGTAQPPRISLNGDRFTLIMASGERHPTVAPSLTLDLVVVGGNPKASRIYYDGGYDPNNTAAPACWSDNGEAPSANAQQPQHPVCATCPRAVWDQVSQATGRLVPACNTVKKIAVVVPSAGGFVFLLQIPPASLKSWRAFLAHLDTLKAPIDGVVIRVGMEEKVLTFDPVDWVPEAAIPMIRQIQDSGEVETVTNVHDRPRQGALAAPTERMAITHSPEDRKPVEAPKPLFVAPPPEPAAPVETEAEALRRQLAEMQAKLASVEGTKAVAAAVEAPVRPTRGRPKATEPRANEVVVGAGPIPAGTFIKPTADPATFGIVNPAQVASPGQQVADALSAAFAFKG